MGGGHDHSHSHGHGHGNGHVEPTHGGGAAAAKEITEDEHEQSDVQRRLKRASVLCATFVLVEVVGGIWAGSLTVLSDAAHLMADLASFLIALAASHYASKPASETYTFGYKRVEALAALFSVSSLALLSVLLAVEGVRRIWLFAAPLAFPSVFEGGQLPDVDGKLMSGIATIGVLVNVALAFVLGEEGVQFHGHSHDHDHGEEGGGCGGHGHGHDHSSHKKEPVAVATPTPATTACHGGHDHGHDHGEHTATEKTNLLNDEEQHNGTGTSHELLHSGELAPVGDSVPSQRNINLHAAYLHVLGDLLQSISVLIAGIVIWIFPDWKIIDPVCTLLFCMIVLRSTFGTFKSSLSVLMEEVPPHLSWSTIYDSISQVDGVSNVHDLHIWSVSHGRPALSVHVNATDPQRALVDISNLCHAHKIDHATIQIQPSSGAIDDKCISCSIGDGMDWSKSNPCISQDTGKKIDGCHS